MTLSISLGTKSAMCSSHSSIIAFLASSSGSSTSVLSSVISSTSDGVMSLSSGSFFLDFLPWALTKSPLDYVVKLIFWVFRYTIRESTASITVFLLKLVNEILLFCPFICAIFNYLSKNMSMKKRKSI